jgi:hypothetical protein
VYDVPLLERRAQSPVQPVLQVELVVPQHDVGEKVAEEGGVLVEEQVELEGVLGGDQVVETDRARRQRSPVPRPETVVWIRAALADTLEDHVAIIGKRRLALRASVDTLQP